MRNRRSFLPMTLVLFSAALTAAGCSSGEGGPPAASISEASTSDARSPSESKSTVTVPVQVRAGEASSDTPAQPLQTARAPEVILKTSLGNIRLRLNADKAPLTVDNFLSNYVERGFYDGTVFHYVDKGFMIAAGGYTAELEPKETRAYVKNEANNGLKNKRGTIALNDNAGLDSQRDESSDAAGYCVFGEVVEGMEIIDRIADVEVADRDQFPKTPVAPIVIESAQWLR